MQGVIKRNKTGGNLKINGILSSYRVQNPVQAGDFVQIVNMYNWIGPVTAASDTILGVAKSNGNASSQIQVYIPNY